MPMYMAFTPAMPLAYHSTSRLISTRPKRQFLLRMTAQPPKPDDSIVPTTTPSSTDYSVDMDAMMDKAKSAFDDVTARPQYYSKIGVFLAIGFVSLTILKSVVSAVDSIPVLPGTLELIGLGYTAWFVWRYILFKESRQELMEEIEDFIGRARPDQ